MDSSTTITSFHSLFYDSQVWRNTYWHDTPVLKCPLDLWIYQELIRRLRPDLIVECGTWAGGATLFMAHMLDLAGNGRILTIDVLSEAQVRQHYQSFGAECPSGLRIRPEHPRIKQLIGSSTDPAIVTQVAAAARGLQCVLLVADSDHSFEHAYAELNAYYSLVTPGSYFIMEDTNIPLQGPRQAVDSFLQQHLEFEIDRGMEKFFLTFNPGGYLKRKFDSAAGDATQSMDQAVSLLASK
jgi:cephalosporin hydroxylase